MDKLFDMPKEKINPKKHNKILQVRSRLDGETSKLTTKIQRSTVNLPSNEPSFALNDA